MSDYSAKLPAEVQDRRLPYTSHVREEGKFPLTKFITVFDYGHCTVEFDGQNWIKKEKQ